MQQYDIVNLCTSEINFCVCHKNSMIGSRKGPLRGSFRAIYKSCHDKIDKLDLSCESKIFCHFAKDVHLVVKIIDFFLLESYFAYNFLI